jgi:Flp pilus assembly protein TadB
VPNPFSAIPDQVLLFAAAGMIFVVLLIACLMTFAPLIDYARHRRRIAQVDQFGIPGFNPGAPLVPQSENPLMQAVQTLSTIFVRSARMEAATADRLDRAGIRLRPNQWVMWRVGACIVSILLFTLLLDPVFGLVIGFIVGFAGTGLFRRVRTDRRYQAFAARLPDALQLVVGSLRAGFSLGQAIDAMIREAPEPIGTEFSRALATTRLGADLDDALARLAQRMRSRDLEWVVIAIRIQREVGGNLAEVVSTNVEAMREREALRRHVRALSAEGRLSAYIICALPPLVIVLMLAIRRDYILPLFTTATGVLLLIAAGVLMTLGTFWMWRVVKVEV